MTEGSNRLIVEHLDGEVLVYDTDSDEAHCLTGDSALEFGTASSDLSRRAVLRRAALVGAAATGAAPLIKTIAAPTAAQAQSGVCPPCPPGIPCCSAAGMPRCCLPGFESCCPVGSQAACCPTVLGCCPAGSINQCGPCNSDRNQKHHLAPVEPRDVLAALEL
jgi:hypothetical protein